MGDDYLNIPSNLYSATTQKIIELAEEHLELELSKQEFTSDKRGEEILDDCYLEIEGIRLTSEDARRIYDSMGNGKEDIGLLARKLVGIRKIDVPFTKYNFDDALVDVMKIGVYFCRHIPEGIKKE